MVFSDEDESEWHEVSDFITDATCVEILVAAHVEGLATIDCFGVTKALRKHLCQALARFQERGDHRFDTLVIKRDQGYVWIYPSQTDASGRNGEATFYLTCTGIRRWRW